MGCVRNGTGRRRCHPGVQSPIPVPASLTSRVRGLSAGLQVRDVVEPLPRDEGSRRVMLVHLRAGNGGFFPLKNFDRQGYLLFLHVKIEACHALCPN